MRIRDRDRILYESLAGDLIDIQGGDTRWGDRRRQLADELVRNGPRGWVTPDGRVESNEHVAVCLWVDHVREIRERRDMNAARVDAKALLSWWDDLDTEGRGYEAVRMISQELRLLREPTYVTPDKVREAKRLARVWGFEPPY